MACAYWTRILAAVLICAIASVAPTIPASAAPGSKVWATDSVPPQTNIVKAKVRRGHGLARFRFVSSEPGSTFRCKLDDHRFRSCSSPTTYRHLKEGRHAFRVRATSGDGTSDATAARRRFFTGRGFGGPPFPPYKSVEPARFFNPLGCPSPSSWMSGRRRDPRGVIRTDVRIKAGRLKASPQLRDLVA